MPLISRGAVAASGVRRGGPWAVSESNNPTMPYDTGLDPLRDDPRFVALVQKMGFPK